MILGKVMLQRTIYERARKVFIKQVKKEAYVKWFIYLIPYFKGCKRVTFFRWELKNEVSEKLEYITDVTIYIIPYVKGCKWELHQG